MTHEEIRELITRLRAYDRAEMSLVEENDVADILEDYLCISGEEEGE